jgi:hypothetical protein
MKAIQAMVKHDFAPLLSKPREKVHTVVGRYVRARREDLVGDVTLHRATRAWINQMITDLQEQGPTESVAKTDPAASPPTWAEVVVQAGLTVNDLRQQYAADALLARAWLLGVGISGLILLHQGWLGHAASASASLGAALALAGLALSPAYRCWRIRRRTLNAPRWFLRRPTDWWPPPFPENYTL